uniref:tetratricopeptide repeat protein n=1 Tax=Frankia sp. CiP3 TaxID=2880971 RepID=UPI001EF5C551
TYTNLGILAQRRGDYPAAEARYQQALAIREELGDRAGLAATSTNLGDLRTRQGRPAEGVPLALAGLAALLQLGSPDAVTALNVLRAQREHLGDEAFFAIAREHVDADRLDTLTAMLDRRPDRATDEDPAATAPGPYHHPGPPPSWA